MDTLQQARAIIDQVDAEMARLFEQRMEAVKTVAAYKKETGTSITDSAREEVIIQRGADRIENDELRGFYMDFMRDTMAVSRRYQRKLISGMRIAYSGVEGAFAHIAAEKVFPDGEKVAFADFKETYDAVVNGDCDAAVLPLENSYAGEVGQVTDLLFAGPLYINGTVALPIVHDLLAVEGARMEDITTVLSHPQALAQCDKFIRQNGFTQVSCENTAVAAKQVAAAKDKTVAAIAGAESAKRYGLKILAQGINESYANTTRFAVLSRSENRQTAQQKGAHFALMFTVRNEAGSLARALNIIGAHGFNMRTLRSRPMKDLQWQYYFYVEAEGNIHSYEGKCMLEALAVCCDRLKTVGTFI